MIELCGATYEYNVTSAEEMIRSAVLMKHEEFQFENGPFKGHQRWVHTSHIQLSYHIRSRGIIYQGKTPQNAYVFALVKCDSGVVTHNGITVNKDELIVLNENDRTDLTTSKLSTIVGMVFEKVFFETEFEKYFNKPFDYDRVHKRLQLKKNAETSFLNSAKEILEGLMPQGEKLKQDLQFHDTTEAQLLQILFQHIDISKNRKKVLKSDIAANKIREDINLHYKEYLPIKQILSSRSFSDRTNRSHFKRLFGISIKQYLTQYRLGRIHYDLFKADCSSTTVENLAYSYGFTHMGRFSNQYKTMFGQTPYNTLKESPPS